MAEKEYIERGALIENAKRIYCTDCNSYNGVLCRACGTGDALDMIEDAPAADVAPRAEVAAEIFAEIEKIILDNTYPDFNSKHKPVNIWNAKTGYDAFYKLKKKYTEEQPCNQTTKQE